jgi:UDP-glucose:(heptosyl)LPS alpha-1,3-glucosyltransferase
MKIGLQIERFDPQAGGAEAYTCELTRRLLDQGHAVHLITRSWMLLPAGVQVHAVPAGGFLRWGRDRSFARNADALAATQDLDVVLSMGKTFAMDVLQPHGGTVRGSQQQNLALIASPLYRTLKALFNRISPKHVAARRRETRQYARRPLSHLVAISQMVARDMRRFYNVPENRLHLVYNGVDLLRFHPQRLAALRSAARRHLGIGTDQRVFALIAHNFKLKGVAQLIEAAAIVNSSKKDFRVLIAGKGKARCYQTLARKLGCAERIVFAGAVEQIENIYAAADVYVHPTWYDPCSLVVLEALACGLPVITSRFNGAGEIIAAGREGFLVDTPRDIECLAEFMGRLFDDTLVHTMGRQARALAEQFSWERNVAELTRVLELAAAEKAGGSSTRTCRTANSV